MGKIKSNLKQTGESAAYQRLTGILYGLFDNPVIKKLDVVHKAREVADCLMDNFDIRIKEAHDGTQTEEVER